MGDKLYIVIPAYNEEENIEKVVKEWYQIVEQFGNESKLVVIDDGSKDQTYTKLLELAEGRPALVPLTKANGGHGATVLYGYRYALENGADYIFQTDSDGQTEPGEFVYLWNKRVEFDMVIGNRNHRKDGGSRIFVTKVLKVILRMIFGVWVKDANTPFRIMKSSTLKEYLSIMPEDYNLPNIIISVAYIKNKKKVEYIPITFRQRQGGINSINLRKIAKIGIQAIKDFRFIKKQIVEMSR